MKFRRQIQSMDQASKQDDVHEVKFTHKQKQRDMKPENKKHLNNRRNEKPCDRCGGKHRPGKTVLHTAKCAEHMARKIISPNSAKAR